MDMAAAILTTKIKKKERDNMRFTIKEKIKSVVVVIFLALISMNSPAKAAGILTPKNSNLPELDIKDHHVKVVLEEGYAITTVEQVFINSHNIDLEAIYSFPVPDKAAVAEFTMWIDGKPVNGEVLEKKKAREVYEDQKSKNKNTGITEKNGYKTFEISVYPVKAQGETKIRLSYIQPAHVDTGIGRYLYPLQAGGVDDEALDFWTSNEKVLGAFSFDLELRSAYPIDNIRLPNHPNAVITRKADKWFVHLDNQQKAILPSSPKGESPLTMNNQQKEEISSSPISFDTNFRLNTDIVVYYRHADGLPGSVNLVAYKEKEEKRGTFMMTLTPGMDLQLISEGRDWIFILDISGSMQGKYATLAEGISRSLKTMNPKDRFSIVLFNSRAKELTPGFVSANPENVAKYVNAVSAVSPNEGTNLYNGLQLGLKSLDADRTTSIILVTDGVANVGETHQRKFIELIKKYDIRLFTFIMGNSTNKPLLSALTRASNGFALNVSNSDDIIGKILLSQSKVNFQSLHGARVKISGIKAVDVTPKEIGSLYRGQQLIILGHYFGQGRAEVTLSGKISGEEKIYKASFDFPDVADENPEIERLWAYATIETLTQEMEDFGHEKDLENSITDLGVEYSLVTDYTSMVVVEEDVFRNMGIDQRNKKRLKNEYNAGKRRASSVIKNRRVDSHAPMFTKKRPHFSGGAGALDPISLFIVSPLLWGFRPRKDKDLKGRRK